MNITRPSLLIKTLAAIAMTVLLSINLTAQRGTGIIDGRAVDREGAVLPGARVRLDPGGITGATTGQGGV